MCVCVCMCGLKIPSSQIDTNLFSAQNLKVNNEKSIWLLECHNMSFIAGQCVYVICYTPHSHSHSHHNFIEIASGRNRISQCRLQSLRMKNSRKRKIDKQKCTIQKSRKCPEGII